MTSAACSSQNEDNPNPAEGATYSVTTEELNTSRDGLNIYGVLHRPQGAQGKLPLVIVSHGFGGNHREGETYAQLLAGMGYLAYAFDFVGGSSGSRSDGRTTDMSVLTEKADLEAILATLKTRPDVDPDRITLLGVSQGGFVSTITAADHLSEIKNLILIYPAFSLVDDAHNRFNNNYNSIPATSSLFGTTISAKYYQDAWNINIYDIIRSVTKPVLLLHGDRDNIVNISYAERTSQTFPNVTYHPIAGGSHGFSGNALRNAHNYI
ncbi:alpha/beta hydrolase [Capnocytophaga sp. HP1101]